MRQLPLLSKTYPTMSGVWAETSHRAGYRDQGGDKTTHGNSQADAEQPAILALLTVVERER